jgi:hemerythrin
MPQLLAEWSPTLEVGLPGIDAQHKVLFELATTVAGDRDEMRVMTAVNTLCDYVRVHFREEEHMLKACGFPGLEAHQLQHVEFREMLAKLLKNARRMTLDQIAAEVKYLINGWFYNHILTVDFEYVDYVKGSLAAAQTGSNAGASTAIIQPSGS